MNNTFKYVSNIRRVLYDHFYSNPVHVSHIIENILQNFDLFSINYNAANNSIELKIKKTNIRKNSSFSHTSTYYYTAFNPIFYSVFSSNAAVLRNIINSTKDAYGLVGDEIDYILNESNISLLFNITTMSDNIVIIYL